MRLLTAAALVALAFAQTAAAAPPRYELVKTVPLGPPDEWDFVHFDPAQDRVYVAHSSEITVLNGRTGAITGRISGIAGAHDVATAPALGLGFADNGDTGTVTVFNLHSLRQVATLPADKDADAMAYDAATGLLVVGSGDAKAASIIDVRAGKRVADVPLGGSAEQIALDGSGKAFINVDTANTIARLDLRAHKIDARWPTPGCEAPHGLAYDTSARRLFASCKNAQMIVIEAVTGKPLALLPIGRGTDGAAFDPVRKLAFSANKDGTLSVVAERGGRFVSLGDEPTAPGARTIAIDPATGRIFLVAATVTAQHPAQRAGALPELVLKPGSVKLLMLDPAK